MQKSLGLNGVYKCRGPHCGDCGKALAGIPCLRPIEYRRLKKRERRVNRPYGGSRCHLCVRNRIMRAFLIEEQRCVKQVLAEKLSQAKQDQPPILCDCPSVPNISISSRNCCSRLGLPRWDVE